MKKVYKKLVRDNIISLIESENKKCNYKILNKKEYLDALYTKLKEECEEFEADNSIEELADVQEVIDAIVAARGLSKDDFEKIKKRKSLRNGKFCKKIFLIDVEEK